MTDDMIALSRRAVASRGWRWMPGMMRLRAASPGTRDYLLRAGRVPDGGDTWDYAAWPVIPDLSDPATLGCLRAVEMATQEERADVVAWIRRVATDASWCGAHGGVYDGLADAIENGEHRREENP
jgi:hypothetical protein